MPKCPPREFEGGFPNYTSPDHSYDFFKYKILRISRNSKDSRKGQDRIVGSALLVFAPAALRPVVIIDL